MKRHEVAINHSCRIHVENREELRKCITARVFLTVNFHTSSADHEDFFLSSKAKFSSTSEIHCTARRWQLSVKDRRTCFYMRTCIRGKKVHQTTTANFPCVFCANKPSSVLEFAYRSLHLHGRLPSSISIVYCRLPSFVESSVSTE